MIRAMAQARYLAETLEALDACERLYRAADLDGNKTLAEHYRGAYNALMAARIRLEQGS